MSEDLGGKVRIYECRWMVWWHDFVEEPERIAYISLPFLRQQLWYSVSSVSFPRFCLLHQLGVNVNAYGVRGQICWEAKLMKPGKSWPFSAFWGGFSHESWRIPHRITKNYPPRDGRDCNLVFSLFQRYQVSMLIAVFERSHILNHLYFWHPFVRDKLTVHIIGVCMYVCIHFKCMRPVRIWRVNIIGVLYCIVL